MPRPFNPLRQHAPGIWQTDHVAWTPDGAVIVQIGYSDVPPRSPYQAGDWVRQHGYGGYPTGPRQWGWRGYVLGYMGATLLCGITDDGQEWVEYWGALDLDRPGKRKPVPGCECCPQPQRFAPRPPLVEQLDLFGGAKRVRVVA